jgi:hypothetical protein
LRIAFSIRWFDRFKNVITFISIMHAIVYALSCFIAIFMIIWTNRWRRFFWLRLRLILKNDCIDMFNDFQSLFRNVFILANRFFEMNVFFNRFFLHNSIIAERWNSFLINDQKFLDKHCFEIEEILNIENQNSIFEIFSNRYSDFNLIFEWWLLQCLKFLVYLFLNLSVDFLVFND